MIHAHSFGIESPLDAGIVCPPPEPLPLHTLVSGDSHLPRRMPPSPERGQWGWQGSWPAEGVMCISLQNLPWKLLRGPARPKLAPPKLSRVNYSERLLQLSSPFVVNTFNILDLFHLLPTGAGRGREAPLPVLSRGPEPERHPRPIRSPAISIVAYGFSFPLFLFYNISLRNYILGPPS